MSKNKNSSSEILGLLGVAFIVLKLCGVIHWSWWWVLAPFWGAIAILIGVVGLYFLGLWLFKIGEKMKDILSVFFYNIFKKQ